MLPIEHSKTDTNDVPFYVGCIADSKVTQGFKKEPSCKSLKKCSSTVKLWAAQSNAMGC